MVKDAPYLVFDANVIIYFASRELVDSDAKFVSDSVNGGTAFISDVTYIECLAVSKEKANNLIAMQRIINNFNRIKLHEGIIEDAIGLCQVHALKVRDAIASATAISLGCSIVTNDLRGFHKIQGLDVIRVKRQA